MITIEQFLEELQRTLRDWRVLDSKSVSPGAIRRGDSKTFDYQCPLGALAHKGTACVYPDDYGILIGLSPEDTKEIYRAADNMTDHDPVIRQQLLAACGL
jgi:hypothetical protein